MEQNKALEVLIQVALKAQGSGILSLDEAVIVKEAIEVFIPKKDEQENEEVKED